MLARVAENLYWIGRNLERAEHCTRFLKVQYYSTLDAPMLQNKDFTLRSILFMSGSEFVVMDMPPEKEVWNKVIFDYGNPSSIFSIIRNARENARSIRNALSTELWESINKWFLFSKNYKVSKFDSGKIYSFSESHEAHIATVKSNISNSLLHNDIWHFINLGIFVERAMQIIRILRSKISDWSILSNNGVNKALMIYQWTIMLKSLEAFDMHNYHFKGQRSKATIFNMILGNTIFPRAVIYTFNKIAYHLESISVRTDEFEDVFEILSTLIKENLDFTDYGDEEFVVNYLEDTYRKVSNLHHEISNMYFN